MGNGLGPIVDEESWPSVDPAVLSFLKRHFGTPLHVQAAFDSEDDCMSLLALGFPDMIEEDLRNEAAILV